MPAQRFHMFLVRQNENDVVRMVRAVLRAPGDDG